MCVRKRVFARKFTQYTLYAVYTIHYTIYDIPYKICSKAYPFPFNEALLNTFLRVFIIIQVKLGISYKILVISPFTISI